MNVHFVLHVPYETPGYLTTWFNDKGATCTFTHCWEQATFPPIEHLDIVIMMGGPMSVSDEQTFPWLHVEKQWILKLIQAGKKLIGICLGAQLLAECLGAKVVSNSHTEIGWFPIKFLPDARSFTSLDQLFTFHWHGDTFSLPTHSKPLATSEACSQQGFLWNNQVLGLQFHPEMTVTSIEKMLEHGGGELRNAPFIQSREEIRNLAHYCKNNHHFLDQLLNVFLKQLS